jgi:hypothetical protein
MPHRRSHTLPARAPEQRQVQSYYSLLLVVNTHQHADEFTCNLAVVLIQTL